MAGVRSERGDLFQVQVALEWTIRLLGDEGVEWLQFESLGGDDETLPPPVDDVVVRRLGQTIYVQAKKTQPARGIWSVTDAKLKPELAKARVQLERDPEGEVWLYSQDPFGRLTQLVEEARAYPSWAAFEASIDGPVSRELTGLASAMGVTDEEAYALARRIRTKQTLDFEDWDEVLRERLANRFARPDEVRRVLVEEIERRQGRVERRGQAAEAISARDETTSLTREECEALLRAAGHVRALPRPVADIEAAFKRASKRGRQWKCDVDGETIERPEVGAVLGALEEGIGEVAVTSPPGMGKTCVLLDVVEAVEAREGWSVLFIRGDQFEGVGTKADLVEKGLPDDLVGQASRLAVSRRVVVVLDALDVLSLQRASGTLSLFLGLVDELSGVRGVSVVVACRDFDLTYATELRGRTWERRVRIAPLPLPTVEDMLRRWGVDPESLGTAFVEHVRVPQHLRLYGQLVRAGVTEVAAGPYALHNRFLDELVVEATGLGQAALDALGALAARMQSERRQTIPRSAFPGDSAMIEPLRSAEVLTETESGTLAFSHQELLDVAAVRVAVRDETTFAAFLRRHAPLPYLRPTVRAFFFMLRAEDDLVFRREVRAVLRDPKVAYHLRRLVAESLAEVTPTEADAPLLRSLWRGQPDLFERFLRRVEDPAWLDVVLRLLDEARSSQDAERWTPRLFGTLDTWLTTHSSIVLGAWKTALREAWPGLDRASWQAARAVLKALKTRENAPPPQEAGAILRLLLDRDNLGHALDDVARGVRTWVSTVDGDDDLVWDVLRRQGHWEVGDFGHRRFDGGGVADLTAPFLQARFERSEELLDKVVEAFAESAGPHAAYTGGSLADTSWSDDHEAELGVGGDLAGVLRPLEAALTSRAVRGDTWWTAHEPQLRAHPDLGIRYLVLKAYLAAPRRHADAATALLTDRDFLEEPRLESEAWALAYAVYPFLSDDQREAHQRAVMERIDPNETDERRQRGQRFSAFQHLVWVPAMWRCPEAGDLVEAGEAVHGPYRPGPHRFSSGGTVAPPFGTDQLLALSDQGVVKLAVHFGTTDRWETDGFGNPVGGWHQVVGVFREAAVQDPGRMHGVLSSLIDGAEAPYADAIVFGVGTHLQIRFGNLSSTTWAPVQPMESGETIARRLLRVLEIHGDRGFRPGYTRAPTWSLGGPWLSESSAIRAIQGCMAVLTSPPEADRLTLLLTRMAGSADPEAPQNNAPSDALDTVRGTVAGSAIRLAGRILEAGETLPDLMAPLLHRLAGDPVPGVRHASVSNLAWIAHYDEALGWGLAEAALAEVDGEVWQAAERLLYHSYRDRFERVAPVLDRMEAKGVAPEVWGRISTLSALSGHRDLVSLLAGLKSRPFGAWKGLAQVLSANVANAAHRSACRSGMVWLAENPDTPTEALDALGRAMNKDEVRRAMPDAVVGRLIAAMKGDEDAQRWHLWRHVAEWIEEVAETDPQRALEPMERLARAGGTRRGGFSIARDALGRAFNALLREADDENDLDMIHRVMALQGDLSRSGLVDLDAMLDAAGRR